MASGRRAPERAGGYGGKALKRRAALRRRIFDIIEVGSGEDLISRGYDFFSAAVVVISIIANILYTFDGFRTGREAGLAAVEAFAAVFFAADYALRIWTAQYRYPDMPKMKAPWRYALSFVGVMDLLSFLPFFLPFFFPQGAVVFRMLRVIRILRLFRINAYYDALYVITEVLVSKSQQLISSVFMILLLMLASSLCMYSLEHQAQPEVFRNAFSGIWWSVSTLLTVGYGDIYPITTAGQVFAIIISFLGVGMVAVPTGIISAGFVEQYTRAASYGAVAAEENVQFIKLRVEKKDPWCGKAAGSLGLPERVVVALIVRDGEAVVPRDDIVLEERDVLVIGAEGFLDGASTELKKLTLRKNNSWNGRMVRELDISRRTVVSLIRRNGKLIVPKGGTVLEEGDEVFLCTRTRLPDAEKLKL